MVSNYQHPYPDGTAAVVLVDTFATGKPDGYYIVPIDDIKRILRRLFDEAFPDGKRPVSPGSLNSVVTPRSVEMYRDEWRFYAAD